VGRKQGGLAEGLFSSAVPPEIVDTCVDETGTGCQKATKKAGVITYGRPVREGYTLSGPALRGSWAHGADSADHLLRRGLAKELTRNYQDVWLYLAGCMFGG